MIVLDTNVVSEVFRPRPNPGVVTWLESLTGHVAITAVTLAELRAGIERLADGKRKSALTTALNAVLEQYRATQAILPFDDAAAEEYAAVLLVRERAGKPIHTADAQIAAICRAHRATCATRNINDFVDTGIELVDPWNA
ncbi:type II toxin-antitoxin system VapC family toxin [Nesterenkonia salmonea]|uniref:Ribonuclease VapC n=1 Tax=Nesterenkonia salmonea TaxID=1804987 RepID=A0A5R9BK01_9MICC|nr:type II toxin-antitoxin system VapC family toxin [Nesterenkonia salmonea]TLQ01004.1 type II toxin-antitoxin system VapC family toxin [Nesterenkonia salmonea]